MLALIDLKKIVLWFVSQFLKQCFLSAWLFSCLDVLFLLRDQF